MRTAYLFSGHLRSFRRNTTLRPLLFDVNPPAAVFVHTYRTRNFHGNKWHTDDSGAGEQVEPEDRDWLYRTYPGMAARRFHQDHLGAGFEHMPPGLENCGFRHTRQAVNELRQQYEKDTGVAFDLVVMLRFDIGLREPLILPTEIDQNTLYAAHNANMIRQGLDSDTITYGSPAVIDAINIPAVPPELADKIDGGEMCGEKLCTAVRQLRGIDYKIHPVRHFFYRSDSELDVDSTGM